MAPHVLARRLADRGGGAGNNLESAIVHELSEFLALSSDPCLLLEHVGRVTRAASRRRGLL
jgi:hypothetical protein